MPYSRRSEKGGWTLFLFILAGIVIGGLLGSATKNIPVLQWLNLGYSFGMDNAVTIDLKILTLLFKLQFDITIASIIGIAIAVFAYKKFL